MIEVGPAKRLHLLFSNDCQALFFEQPLGSQAHPGTLQREPALSTKTCTQILVKPQVLHPVNAQCFRFSIMGNLGAHDRAVIRWLELKTYT